MSGIRCRRFLAEASLPSALIKLYRNHYSWLKIELKSIENKDLCILTSLVLLFYLLGIKIGVCSWQKMTGSVFGSVLQN